MTYITLAELKADLGITGNSDDAMIQKALDSAVGYIDSYTDRTFAVTAPSVRVFGSENLAAGVLYLPEFFSIRAIWRGFKQSADSEIAADPSALSMSDDLFWTSVNGSPPFTRLHSSSDFFTSPNIYVSINAFWGFSESPPAAIAGATLALSRYLYRLSLSYSIPEPGDPVQLPRAVNQLIRPYRRLV